MFRKCILFVAVFCLFSFCGCIHLLALIPVAATSGSLLYSHQEQKKMQEEMQEDMNKSLERMAENSLEQQKRQHEHEKEMLEQELEYRSKYDTPLAVQTQEKNS